jgi:hypothetical protein
LVPLRKKTATVKHQARRLRALQQLQKQQERRTIAAHMEAPIDPFAPPQDLIPDPTQVDPPQQLPNQGVTAISLEQLKASAKLAYDLRCLEDRYDTALAVMHEMDGVIDDNNPDIVSMKFTDLQMQELFKRYCETPRKSVTNERSMRLMEHIFKINKKITPKIAEEFKEWSDRYPDQPVKLTTLVDAGAIFTLNHAIFQGKDKLGITEEKLVDSMESSDISNHIG